MKKIRNLSIRVWGGNKRKLKMETRWSGVPE